MIARRLHRGLAAALALFLGLHLAHHASLLGGVQVHLDVMALIRPLYRWLPVEIMLLAVFAAQIVLGLRLAWRKRRVLSLPGAPLAHWVQITSGVVLGLFVAVHVGATLSARVNGLDTTTHFAAAGFYHPLWRWFFVLYYPAGIMALALHLSALAHLRHKPMALVWAPVILGGILAAIVLGGLSGSFGGPPPPQAYHM